MKADVEVKGEGVEGKRNANWLDSSRTVGQWECGNA